MIFQREYSTSQTRRRINRASTYLKIFSNSHPKLFRPADVNTLFPSLIFLFILHPALPASHPHPPFDFLQSLPFNHGCPSSKRLRALSKFILPHKPLWRIHCSRRPGYPAASRPTLCLRVPWGSTLYKRLHGQNHGWLLAALLLTRALSGHQSTQLSSTPPSVCQCGSTPCWCLANSFSALLRDL